MDVTNPPDFKN